MASTRTFVIAALVGLVACGGGEPKPPTTGGIRPAVAPTADPGAKPEVADPLGPKPVPGAPTPFVPPVPQTYTRPSGLTVWLVERRTLPIVSVSIVVPAGAARDPEGKGGLAQITAKMLERGAGKRGALEIASDVDRLGASLHTGATADYAFAQLTTLKKNLEPAASILGDVVGKPAFSPVEWKRAHDLWQNDLKQRTSNPQAVAGVVLLKHVYDETSPYRHPTDGTVASAAKVTLDDAKRFYDGLWRPENATAVVVGDVTRAELDAVLDKALAVWKPTSKAPAPTMTAAKPESKPTRKIIVVDRADAPQSVIAVARRGVEAKSAEAPLLSRANQALGGSFTSRLNQDLREEHGWSYGASSRLSWTRERGIFVAQAAVQTEHTGEALKAMLDDVTAFSKSGLTDEEFAKTGLLARTDLVESFETVEAAARRLARNVGVGLGPNHEAEASARLYKATKADLAKVAAEYMDPSNAVIVIVGPKSALEPQLKSIGLGAFEVRGPEGE